MTPADQYDRYQDKYADMYRGATIEPDYICNACRQGFGIGWGVKIEDEKFCNECIEQHKHLVFYRDECGLSVSDILMLDRYHRVKI